MAKGNLFLGHAKGKVGSIVFSRAFGQQISRTKPTSVANPKTIGQNTQRAILATIAKSAAAMTSLVDHSFANIAYGAESVRHFRKINMGLLRNLYMNTQNGANLCAKGGNFVPNPLKVSEGSLQSFVSIVDDKEIGFVQNAANTMSHNDAVTVSDFLKAFPYLQGGDQITLVKVTKVNDGELIDGDALFALSLDRIVFAPNAFDDLEKIIIEEGDSDINTDFLDLTKTTDPACVGRNATGGLGFSGGSDVYYAALILSRKVNNTWQRSTQYLEQINFDDHTENESAIASYGATSSLNEATEYLNQAEEGSASQGVKGSYMHLGLMNGESLVESVDINAGAVGTREVAMAVGDELKISAAGYAASGARIITVEVDDSTNNAVAHGSKSVEYSKKIAATDKGVWKVTTLFSDGSRAEYDITITIS